MSEVPLYSGWLRASALTCRLISLVGVQWSCLRIKQAFLPLWGLAPGKGFGISSFRFGVSGFGFWVSGFRFTTGERR